MKCDFSSQHCHRPSAKGAFSNILRFLTCKQFLYNKKTDIGRCIFCNAIIRAPDSYYAPFTMSIRMLAAILSTILGNWLFGFNEVHSFVRIVSFFVASVLGWLLCNRLIAMITLAMFSWVEIDEENAECIHLQEERAKKQLILRIYSFIIPAMLTFLTSTNLRPTYLQFVILFVVLSEEGFLAASKKLIFSFVLFTVYLISLLVISTLPALTSVVDTLTILMFCGLLLWEGYARR